MKDGTKKILFTDTFVSSMPWTIFGRDSRFEYDLNRDPKNCVYKDAWGKQVWKTSRFIEKKGKA